MLRSIVVVVVALPLIGWAGNPDERASMEFDLTKYFTNYERSSDGSSIFPGEDKAGPLNLDVRVIVPSRENLSLLFGMGYVHEETRLFNIVDKRSGFYINFGLKFYLPGR